MIDTEYTFATFNVKGWSGDEHDGGNNGWINRAPLTIDLINNTIGADCVGLQEFDEDANLEFYEDHLSDYEPILGPRIDNGWSNPIFYKRSRFQVESSGIIWLSQNNVPEPDWGANEIR